VTLQDIINLIKEDDVKDLTKKLVNIPSTYSDGEYEICQFLYEELNSLGFSSKIIEVQNNRPNLVSEFSGGSEDFTFMFNGHLDVVPPGNLDLWEHDPYDCFEMDSKLYGRGTTDMKGGLAAMIIAMKALISSNNEFNGTIIFTGVMDEERTGLGAKTIVDSGIQADACVVGEPSNGKVCRAQKGTMWFDINTKGISKHASQITLDDSENAIYKMSKIIPALHELNNTLFQKKHDLVGHSTINIGKIYGGVQENIVPDHCKISIDLRLLPDDNPNQIIDDVVDHLKRSGIDSDDFEINIKHVRESAIIPETELIVSKTCEAIEFVKGTKSQISGMHATTDMSFFTNIAKIPTVILGPGKIEDAHTVNESIDILELYDMTKIYTALLHSLFK